MSPVTDIDTIAQSGIIKHKDNNIKNECKAILGIIPFLLLIPAIFSPHK
jgi:hypothetical protein